MCIDDGEDVLDDESAVEEELEFGGVEGGNNVGPVGEKGVRKA